MSLMPGDLVKLLSPVAHYPAGTTARVITVPDGDECVMSSMMDGNAQSPCRHSRANDGPRSEWASPSLCDPREGRRATLGLRTALTAWHQTPKSARQTRPNSRVEQRE